MVSQSSNNGVATGFINPQSTYGDYNNLHFIISQALAKMQTALPVKIISCTNSGGVSPVGFVDIVPMINQVDGQGTPTTHLTIYNVPYLRIQGGTNAIIIDPVAGDIGVCVFASRDISTFKTTRKTANPASHRSFSFSDGFYLGGFLNAAPVQYIQFSADGIKIYSPTKINLTAPVVTVDASTSCTITTPIAKIDASTSCTITTPTFRVNGNTELNGTISGIGGNSATLTGTLHVNQNITSDADVIGTGTSLHSHVHGGVLTGGSNTGTPV